MDDEILAAIEQIGNKLLTVEGLGEVCKSDHDQILHHIFAIEEKLGMDTGEIDAKRANSPAYTGD